MRKYLLSILTVMGFLGSTVPSSASFLTFTDRNAFLAATSSTTNITFEGLAPINWYTNFGSGLTQSGVTFSGTGSYLFVVDPGYSPAGYDWGSGQVLLGPSSGAINVSLPTGYNAVGSDIMSILNYAAQFTITLENSSSYTFSSNNFPGRAFAGFISTDSYITSISFEANGSAYPLLDNFVFGIAVPVPAGMISAGIGSILIGGAFMIRSRKLRLKKA